MTASSRLRRGAPHMHDGAPPSRSCGRYRSRSFAVAALASGAAYNAPPSTAPDVLFLLLRVFKEDVYRLLDRGLRWRARRVSFNGVA